MCLCQSHVQAQLSAFQLVWYKSNLCLCMVTCWARFPLGVILYPAGHAPHAYHSGSKHCLALLSSGKGTLTYLQWNDMTCNNCGGKADARCIQVTTGTDAQHSCGSKCWQTCTQHNWLPCLQRHIKAAAGWCWYCN